MGFIAYSWLVFCLGAGIGLGDDEDKYTLPWKKKNVKIEKDSELSLEVKKNFVDSRVKVDHLLDQYEIDESKILGEGSFGTVYEACHKKDKTIKIAIKTVNKSSQSKEEIMLLHRELRILSKLDNPNIAKYYENYEDEHFIYICMELC